MSAIRGNHKQVGAMSARDHSHPVWCQLRNMRFAGFSRASDPCCTHWRRNRPLSVEGHARGQIASRPATKVSEAYW